MEFAASHTADNALPNVLLSSSKNGNYDTSSRKKMNKKNKYLKSSSKKNRANILKKEVVEEENNEMFHTPRNDIKRKKKKKQQQQSIDTSIESSNNGFSENKPSSPLSSSNDSVESELLPDKHYSHLRCIQKLSHVHNTIWEVLTTPSPTRASKRGADGDNYKEFVEEKIRNIENKKASTFLTELSKAQQQQADQENALENSSTYNNNNLNPKPPAGSPPRSGRTPYKWHPGDEMIASLITTTSEVDDRNGKSPSLFRETKDSSSTITKKNKDVDDNNNRRNNKNPRRHHSSGRSKQKHRHLRKTTDEEKRKRVDKDKEEKNMNRKVNETEKVEEKDEYTNIQMRESTPTTTSTTSSSRRSTSSRRRRRGKKVSSPAIKRNSKNEKTTRRQRTTSSTTISMSQAPSPSTSPHQQQERELALKFKESRNKDENKSPNIIHNVKEPLVTSPSSLSYDEREKKEQVEEEEEGEIISKHTTTANMNTQRLFQTRNNGKNNSKDRISSTMQSKGPIKLIRSKRTPSKKIGPDTRSSRLPPPKSPYSHLRCVQNLHIINSPPKDLNKKVSNINDVNSNGDNVNKQTSSGSMNNNSHDDDDNNNNPDQIEAVLVAGKIKPVPCIALQYRDKHLPPGQLRCLEVQLPIIPKPDDLPMKMYIQEYCEYVCHRLCKEAKPFQYIELNQLRRVVTCLSLKLSNGK